MHQIFDTLDASWPAKTVTSLGPWRIRDGAGGGKRVSATTLDGPLVDIDAAEAAQRELGQTPLFQIRADQSDLDTELAARGYEIVDPTIILSTDPRGLKLEHCDIGTLFCDAPLVLMRDIWAAGGIGPARLAVMARCPAPKTYLLGRHQDRVAGVGFCATQETCAMVHALEVTPHARRTGLGTYMMRSAAAWAARLGADTLALAVTRANQPARTFYAKLGFEEIASYHYRRLPEKDTA